MASVKAALKAAKSALDAQDYTSAASQARAVLDLDSKHYTAHIFLGKALEEQGKVDEAAILYEQATKLKPHDGVAWKGLCHAYESQGSRNVSKHSSSALRLAAVYAQREDQHQCQTIVDKLVAFAKEHGSRSQYKEALEAYLPTSPVYSFLEGHIQSPSVTYLRLAEITEADEKERINKEIVERRTRLGAKVSQVVQEVTREVLNGSNLEQLYQSVIDWTNDDDERRMFEEKLLQHAYNHLVSLPSDFQASKRDQVVNLAHGMVIIKHPYSLAWHIELGWQDVVDIARIGRDLLLQYVRLFPSTGLARVVQGFLGVRVQDEQDEEDHDAEHTAEGTRPLSKEDRLLLIDDGISEAHDSALAQRLVAQYYLQDEEYESCIDSARKAIALTQQEVQKCGLSLLQSQDAVRTDLATSLIYHQAPKNHPEARDLFDDVLKRQPHSTAALLGIGLIHEEQENFLEAATFLDRAYARDPDNFRIAAEAAWCKVLNGSPAEGLSLLRKSLEQIMSLKATPYDLKAQVSYRIGRCLWDLNTDRAARKDRDGAYAYFLTAIKSNSSYAPAYTSLGQYYSVYAKDKRRARQCFQKAFELSASELVAAEQLARAFADDADWDIVEVVAKRVIDSGVVRPAPGSKRKAVSWPFAALAVVQMNKQEYAQAVHSYQAALRITPADYHCWVGLGESYLNAGRYNAASKALEHAESLLRDSGNDEEAWFARYMHSNVHRELGDFDEAIAGYRVVLKSRPGESGVAMALLQCLVENAHHLLGTGAFGDAIDLAKETLNTALTITKHHAPSINFWRAIGDACMIIASISNLAQELPVSVLRQLFGQASSTKKDKLLSDIDDVNIENALPQDDVATANELTACISAGLLAQKEAVSAAVNDNHSLSICWYNLGWTEYHAHHLTAHIEDDDVRLKFSRCAKAAVKCFKHAIELEASNADFWNALGVATTSLNPKIAQHSFVRGLHLNQRSARTWTNLGSLYMLQQDYELAHQAFGRAQSTDPDYVYAWLGEGLIALQYGDVKEARSHFRHAMEIGDAADVPVKQQYAAAAFDHLLSEDPSVPHGLEDIVTPIFALQQIKRQSVDAVPYEHLLAMYQERAGDPEAAIASLQTLTDAVEVTYERTEAASSLGQFVQLKSDLARSRLAARSFDDAIDSASTALDLSEDVESDALASAARTKLRLSANLTAGLAYYYQGSMDKSIKMLRAALEKSNSAPNVVCLLAQVLWAKGSEAERSVAKEQLFDCIEKNQGHAGATTLLGAMSAIDGDEQTHEAVMSDLQSMRTAKDITRHEQEKMELLLTTSASLSGSEGVSEELTEISRSVMLAPGRPFGWSRLADRSEDAYAAEMALANTARAVPPDGEVEAEQLSRALADAGTLANAQKAVAICPWLKEGWQSLNDGIG